MNRASIKMAVLTFLVSAVAGTLAQDARELPSGFVFKNQVPEFSAWTIMCVHAGSEEERASQKEAYAAAMRRMAEENPGVAKFLSANPSFGTMKPRVEKIEVTRTGKIRREDILYPGGKLEQRWWSPGIYLQKDAFSGRVFFESGVPDEASPAFPELAWITADKFRGVEKKDGREAWVFESREQRLSLEDPRAFRQLGGTDDEEAMVDVKALIDPKAQMPVSLEWDGQVRTYQFRPAPTVKQTLPPDVAAIVEKSAQRAAAAVRPLSPP